MKKTVLLVLCAAAALAVVGGPVATSHAACPPGVTDLASCTPSAPTATTMPATDITTFSATLNGTVNPNGLETQYRFEYAHTSARAPMTTPLRTIPASYTGTPVSEALTRTIFCACELLPGTTYFFRLVAVNSAGTTFGPSLSFRTEGPARPPGPGGGAGTPTRFTAKLALARASTTGGFLDVLAPITRRASGGVDVEYLAAGRRNRFTAAVDSNDGRIRFRRRLPDAQARLATGILTFTYQGDGDTRPQSVRLRAASQKANLDLNRPRIVDGRIQASGTISSRARGIVRLQLEYQFLGSVRTLRFRGEIEDGRWSIDEPLSAQQRTEIARRTGSVHSYTLFTGFFERRIRGEMRSYQVLGNR